MNEIGEFLKVAVENLDAFVGYEIYIVHDSSAPDESGAWELLQAVRKEMLQQGGGIGEPATMILFAVDVTVDQSKWPSFSDSSFTASFAAGKFARVRPSQRS